MKPYQAKQFFQALGEDLVPEVLELFRITEEPVLETSFRLLREQNVVRREWQFPFPDLALEGLEEWAETVSVSILALHGPWIIEGRAMVTVVPKRVEEQGERLLFSVEVEWNRRGDGVEVVAHCSSLTDPRVVAFLADILAQTVRETVQELRELEARAKASPAYREAEERILSRVVLES